jgi:hypothetical protein
MAKICSLAISSNGKSCVSAEQARETTSLYSRLEWKKEIFGEPLIADAVIDTRRGGGKHTGALPVRSQSPQDRKCDCNMMKTDTPLLQSVHNSEL